MNIAYFGSPSISAFLLEKLLNHPKIGEMISLVVTQPDKPVGKRLEITPTPVKTMAQRYNLDLFDQKLALNEGILLDELKSKQIDLGIVFAYGEFIKPKLLEYPVHGLWNIHPSLLPLYRGPSPIAYPMMLGDKTAGTSIIKLSEIMDAGNIIVQKELEINPDEVRAELELRLTELSIEVLETYVTFLEEERNIQYTPQNNKTATITKLLTKQDGYISQDILQKALLNQDLGLDELPKPLFEYINQYNKNWLELHKSSAINIYNYYRAMNPWPGIWTQIKTNVGVKRLKLNKMSYKGEKLIIEKVQLEGKNEIDFTQFNKTYNIYSL